LRTFEGNESIIQCGDEGRFIGVLIDGHGEISIADSTGGRIVMSALEAGRRVRRNVGADRVTAPSPTSLPATVAWC
jgi:acetate kinase